MITSTDNVFIFILRMLTVNVSAYHHFVWASHSIGHHVTIHRNQQVPRATKNVNIFVVPQERGIIVVKLFSLVCRFVQMLHIVSQGLYI